MLENDLIVIGSGLAGLMAAAAASKKGKRVLVLTKGAGTIAIGGGSIDVLGYSEGGRKLDNPLQGLSSLSTSHPYSKIGLPALAAAVEFFSSLCDEAGYPYKGSLGESQWLPTAIGTLKPTCLAPLTMDSAKLVGAKKIVVMGFVGLKDYYPELIVKGLERSLPQVEGFETIMLETGLTGGKRDLNALDIARWLDKMSGRQSCIQQLKGKVRPGNLILTPPVLGTTPDYRLLQEMEEATGCSFIETVGLPPAVTGMRLRNLLVRYLRDRGVRFIEQADVATVIVESGRCQGVITQNIDRRRTYGAKSFVLATGGFFSAGLRSAPGRAWEPIFDLPVDVPDDPEEWSGERLFSGPPQDFAHFGIAVDSSLRPTDVSGRVILDNVFIAGRNLAGYDYCREKSGNGVAMATGYLAGISD